MLTNRGDDDEDGSDPKPANIKSIGLRSSAVSMMSELSVSQSGGLGMDDLHQSMDNIGQVTDVQQQRQPPQEGQPQPQQQARSSPSTPSDVTQDDKDNSPKKRKNFCVTILAELQCILDSDDKELDPFGKRRLTFVFVVAVIAVVVNLVVVPLWLTRLEQRNRHNTTSEVPTTAAPTAGGSMSPTFPGQTRDPTAAPVATSRPTFAPATSTSTLPPVVTSVPAPTLPIEQPPTLQPATVAVALPPYTLAALDNPDSPQSKAFAWLTADPSLSTYTSFRTLQRMSLATLFYATNDKYYKIQLQGRNAGSDPEVFHRLFDHGNDNENQPHVLWTNASNWLSYEIHECFWFSQAPFVCDAQQNYRYLILDNNGLTGRLPPQLGLLTKLEQLHLSDNLQIYGSIPTQISHLTNLQSLRLSNLPQLSGTIPPILTNLHATLEELHLQETPYIPKILSTHLGRLTRLRDLLLDTRINTGVGKTTKQGSIPTQMGNMVNLQAFTITGEELRGTLPSQLSRLSLLRELSICHTQVSGSIPTVYGHLTSLQTLELIHNRLSDSMPKELGYLRPSLTSLLLRGNLLVGSIPFQYSNLTKCKTMAFQQNYLTGAVPLGLCYLRTNNIIHSLQVDCTDDHTTVSASESPIECSCDCDCY